MTAAWRVKYDGTCARCGITLAKGTPAVYDRSSPTIRCIECPTGLSEPGPIDSGTAGASARREYERRSAMRSAELRKRWGDRVGGWIERLTIEPASTTAWATGARGEEQLGSELAGVDGIRLLNDRRVSGTRGNIDHVVIASAGVFVIDAKDWTGTVRTRDVGGWFRTDVRLFVGRRDATRLADGLGWQVQAVSEALTQSRIDPLPRIVPVLCFVDGDWPWFRPPDEFRGVRLESERSIKHLFFATSDLDPARIDMIARALASALPAKRG